MSASNPKEPQDTFAVDDSDMEETEGKGKAQNKNGRRKNYHVVEDDQKEVDCAGCITDPDKIQAQAVITLDKNLRTVRIDSMINPSFWCEFNVAIDKLPIIVDCQGSIDTKKAKIKAYIDAEGKVGLKADTHPWFSLNFKLE